MRNRHSILILLPLVLLASACSSASSGSKAATTATTAPTQTIGVSAALQNDANVTVDTTQWKKSGPYKIAALTQGPFNGWGLTWDVTTKYEAKNNPDVKELALSPSMGDPNKQISSMENLIAQKPDAILLDPMGRAALSASVSRAMAAGIPVIVCGNGVEGGKYVTYVDIDLYAVAFAAADALAKRLGGKGNVVLFHGIAGVDAAETWKKAAEDAFKQYPNIKIVASEYANWSVATGKEKAAAMIAANPQIDGVWSGGSEMATGAILAFKDAGRPQPIYGVDNPTNGFLRLAKDNGIKFNAFPDPPATIAKACLETAIKVLKGQSVKKFEAISAIGYDETQADQHYVADLNDDFVPPLASPMQAYVDAGMKRK
jgi:ribose transport system substrate-binding protein